MPTPFLRNTVIQRNRTLTFELVDNDLVAVDAQAGYCYAFNKTAGRVWELIASPTQVQVICEQLCREYEIDETTCLQSLTRLLEELKQAGLIQTLP